MTIARTKCAADDHYYFIGAAAALPFIYVRTISFLVRVAGFFFWFLLLPAAAYYFIIIFLANDASRVIWPAKNSSSSRSQ